ncbi:response regulator [Pseudomonas sp. GD03842]|uniref:response regulator transcription factor n=1 Tax=Pseudomonas sp. GD03842 TaxID=2975385 RepID=UPI0024477AD7|nr:response regulator [Pseudomonas sp. GD03842]MDH0748895.1 response regulator [Pseudomonas sp. GD03842]
MDHIPRIAIVDDDQSCRMALASLVRSLGYVPCVCSSAEDFLALIDAEDVDCLISDVQMPGMDGLALQRSLLAKGRSLPILFITAYPKESARRAAIAGGALCFLGKPYDAQLIIDCLESVVTKA